MKLVFDLVLLRFFSPFLFLNEENVFICKNLAMISHCHFKIVTLGLLLALRLVCDGSKKFMDTGNNVEM